MSTAAPGGLSAKEFKLFSVEAGQWLLGTVKGAWNEKLTFSQIVTDAVIGMIPVVGDVTAARDLIAVGSGLATSEEKRSHTMEWVLLVIFIFALIPVIGGVIKGVGRLSLRVTENDPACLARHSRITQAAPRQYSSQSGSGTRRECKHSLPAQKYDC